MINRQKSVDEWKIDIELSVSEYNEWFNEQAPNIYNLYKKENISRVNDVLIKTEFMSNITKEIIKKDPKIIQVLRLSTCPTLASDRLTGLSGLAILKASSVVKSLEEGKIPRREDLDSLLDRLIKQILLMLDINLFPWLSELREPNELELNIATCVIADRLDSSVANAAVKNHQEARQIKKIVEYLERNGYSKSLEKDYLKMQPGTYAIHLNIPGVKKNNQKEVKVSVDVVVKSFNQKDMELPILIECKSAGDFTNTNKRRKEESDKFENLTNYHGSNVIYLLLLCGYFDVNYLEYEKHSGIDWVWEHRIEDLDILFKKD